MSLVDKVDVFTTVLNNEVFTIPEGARTIDLYNSGGANATFIGDTPRGGKNPTAVSLIPAQAYSFGNLGKPYPAIQINATGTTVEVTANY